MWSLDDSYDEVEIVCNMVPKCLFCDVPMEVWNIKKLNFDIIRGSGDKSGHAMDIEVVCPECHLEDIFGVALSEDEYGKVRAIEMVHQ